MNTIEIKDQAGGTITISRIDIKSMCAGLALGNRESILEIMVPEAIEKIEKEYGSHRPIQITQPTIEDNFDFSIFMDLTKIHYDEEQEEVVFSNLALFIFCSMDDLNLEHFKHLALTKPDWSNCRSYNASDY
jgi:hypothetical protein